jgi:hypothetical protein
MQLTSALLNSTNHTDTTTGSVVRGDIITGQGATPKWQRLAKGTANKCWPWTVAAPTSRGPTYLARGRYSSRRRCSRPQPLRTLAQPQTSCSTSAPPTAPTPTSPPPFRVPPDRASGGTVKLLFATNGTSTSDVYWTANLLAVTLGSTLIDASGTDTDPRHARCGRGQADLRDWDG